MPHPTSPSPAARYALLLYIALCIYASLYPFEGWTYRGVAPWAFVAAPLPRYLPYSDFVLNILAYVPMGFLIVAAMLPRAEPLQAALAATLAGSALSFAMESLQSLLPARVSSNMDWALNTLGTLLGAGIAALAIPRLRAANALYALRHRWFVTDASYGLLLLGLWPLAQLYPQPVLFGNGNVMGSLTDWAARQGGTPNALLQWLAGWQPAGLSEPQQQTLPVLACALVGALCAAIGRPRAPRWLMALALVALACATTTFSAAMTYGPPHALAWLHAINLNALAAGVAAALALASLAPRWAAVAGLALVLLLLALVNQLPDDPYYALNLQSWQQGRFIRFHGLAEWLGMLWPYFAALYLAKRAAAR